jgi:hypothetical protein
LWAQLGPDAGRPLQMNFMQGPGVFFTTFRTGAPGPDWGSQAEHADVIDAEVVEDDEHQGPPELHAPR